MCLFILCMYVCFICPLCVCWCPWKPKESIEFYGTGGIGSWDPSDVGAGVQIPDFYKNNKCF